MDLDTLGFASFFSSQVDDDTLPWVARAGRVNPRSCLAHTTEGAHNVHIPRRLRSEPEDAPVVGDWLVLSPDGAEVKSVLKRQSRIMRIAAGRRTEPQAIAANVDVVFVVTGLDGDFNLRRIERYLALVHDGGARPVVLLTKAASCPDLAGRLAETRAVSPGVDVHGVDVVDGVCADVPASYAHRGITIALLGSSGAGKSTLVNHLLGEDRMATAPVRMRDDRGCHTTVSRELLWTPEGTAIIDNPGMRELSLWIDRSGLESAFRDIGDLAPDCRFSDCTHSHEPGCAVVAAVERGTLSGERLLNYRKLQAEVRSASQRRDAHGRRAEGRRFARMAKEAKRLKYRDR